MSSGCVLRKVSQLFTCEENYNTIEARKALLEDFTKKRYNAEVVYVDNMGETIEEQHKISFILSEKQNDELMNRITGSAILEKDTDMPIRLSLCGIYIQKKNGYKIRVNGENIEKEFYIHNDTNDKINFFIKKRNSVDSTRQMLVNPIEKGVGIMVGSCNCTFQCLHFSSDAQFFGTCLDDCCPA